MSATQPAAAAPAAPKPVSPSAAVMTATAPRPVAVDAAPAPWAMSPPDPSPARAPSFWPPSRRSTTVIVAAVVLALVAGGVVLIASGRTKPSHSPSATGATHRSLVRARPDSAIGPADALVAAKVRYTDSSSYAKADASGLAAVEPKLCYVGAATASVAHGAKCVSGYRASVSVQASSQTWSAAHLSSSGTCFWIRDEAGVGTTDGSGLPCTGAAAVGASRSTTFPGQAATASKPSAGSAGCADRLIVLATSADALRNERLAIKSRSLSLAIDSIMRAADDWRAVAKEIGKHPRIAAGLRAGASMFYAATDQFSRGQNAIGQRLWRRGLVSINRATAAINRLKPLSC